MIEIQYLDSKPQVIINRKKIKTWETLQEGCVYAEVNDENILKQIYSSLVKLSANHI